jgi:hypothetical protein
LTRPPSTSRRPSCHVGAMRPGRAMEARTALETLPSRSQTSWPLWRSVATQPKLWGKAVKSRSTNWRSKKAMSLSPLRGRRAGPCPSGRRRPASPGFRPRRRAFRCRRLRRRRRRRRRWSNR